MSVSRTGNSFESGSWRSADASFFSRTAISSLTARSLDFFSATAAESRIGRVILSGGGSKVSGLEAAFQGKTNLPVERFNPLARVAPSPRLDAEFLEDAGPSLAVSLGLALRRMDD